MWLCNNELTLEFGCVNFIVFSLNFQSHYVMIVSMFFHWFFIAFSKQYERIWYIKIFTYFSLKLSLLTQWNFHRCFIVWKVFHGVTVHENQKIHWNFMVYPMKLLIAVSNKFIGFLLVVSAGCQGKVGVVTWESANIWGVASAQLGVPGKVGAYECKWNAHSTPAEERFNAAVQLFISVCSSTSRNVT